MYCLNALSASRLNAAKTKRLVAASTTVLELRIFKRIDRDGRRVLRLPK